MAVAHAKHMQMVLDQSAIQIAVEGVQDEMMVALLNTMQGAATTCARICVDRLNALHSQMLRAFEEEARQQQSSETTFFRGDCWEGFSTGTAAFLTPERRQTMNEEHPPSEKKMIGREPEHDVACTGFASDQEAAAGACGGSEVGLSPAPTFKTTSSSPLVASAPSAGGSTSFPQAGKANPGGFEPPARSEKRRFTGGSLARTAMQKKVGLTQSASSVGGSLTRSAIKGIGTMKRAANSAASSAASAANTAAATVQGRSPNATEKTAGTREHHSSAEAVQLPGDSLVRTQTEWWGMNQPTMRSGQQNEPGVVNEVTPRAEDGVPVVQNFCLSDGSSSEEEEAC